MNPVLWCQMFLRNPETGEPLVPYDYQSEILQDDSLLKILRMGRRSGKTKTITIHMLWQCNIRRGITCLVVTPYEKQVLEIFDDIHKLLESSPFLSKASGAYTSTKHPFQIKFSNGSRINLMTAGTKAGSEGAGVRGQPGDWIYLDEMDYLSDKDISTVLSIRQKDMLRVGVIGSSTPTGKRGLFYRFCTDRDAGYKEFHYTFFDSPAWIDAPEEVKDRIVKELKLQFPDEASYKHEVLAEFGEETMGVYNKDFIDRARAYSVADGMIGHPDKILTWDYNQVRNKYELTNTPTKPLYHTIRTIGVDWDKEGAPTEIVVVEWNPYEKNLSGRQGMFRVIGRFEIQQSDRTYTNAVKKIVELNEIFNPDFIYIDKGVGEMQTELLHQYGVDHPETGLHKKVKPIAFGGKIPVKDPFTGIVDNKNTKPFMVNNSVHILDCDLLQLNDEDTLLWRQMENYRIVNVSVNGIPQYSRKDEHALDALNLALLAMTLEFPELSKLISRFEASNVIYSVKSKQIDLFPKVTNYGEVETDPVELLDEKYKHCHDVKMYEKSRGSLQRGKMNLSRISRSKWK